MANMSYCRFHNTRIDMMDCINAIEEEESISEEELVQCKKMFEHVLGYFEDECIIEEMNWDGFEEWIDELSERS